MNISDLIAEFIIETIGDDDLLELSRNELASYFSCAPSQINYVLSTRFTPEKGYVIESRRGGGGGITLFRLRDSKDDLTRQILGEISSVAGINSNKSYSIINRLLCSDIISSNEKSMIEAMVSDKALAFPINIADRLRKQILIEMLVELTKRR